MNIMHLFAEGIIPYTLSCILFAFINFIKFVSLKDLNNQMTWIFTVSEVDKPNTPPQLKHIKRAGKGLSPTANEMLAFLRYLPFALWTLNSSSDMIYSADWDMLFILCELTDIAFAHKFDEAILRHFSYLVGDYFHV